MNVYTSILIGIICVFLCMGCVSETLTYQNNSPVSLKLHEGKISLSRQQIRFSNGKKNIAIIKLTSPVCVCQAIDEQPWGFFQFPSISKTTDGRLKVTWQMAEDSHLSYGKRGIHDINMISKDKGSSWVIHNNNEISFNKDYYLMLDNGLKLGIHTPPVTDITESYFFNRPVKKRGRYSYYLVDSISRNLNGIYINQWDKNNKYKLIHSELKDSGLIRYAIDGLMPVVWWGDMKQIYDGSLIAGIYPAIYLDGEGKIISSVSFYRSTNLGYSWERISKIPFCVDSIAKKYGSLSYEEPTFEILKDGTFICVMRSGDVSPMYKTFSRDFGKTWSPPQPFTPNGVKPHLFLLNNGVLVLVSGRPGIQIRFCLDGTGKEWSPPIDMIKYMNDDGSYDRDVSCGYASILIDGKDSFYLVYSDFTTKNSKGERRKSIMCRRITIKKK